VFNYDEQTETLAVGAGTIQPVSPEVWNFSISDFDVLDSWLGYRMKDPTGKGSSTLDDLRPNRWTAQMTDELLNVVWVLEETVELHSKLEELLIEVLSSPLLKGEELPVPTAKEREEPKTSRATADSQAALFE
jgi:hypothetical protein